VRHSNEVFEEQHTINLVNEPEIPVPPFQQEKKEIMVNIGLKKEKKKDEAGVFSKFWNWATQLF
jgi:cell division protein FtsA